MAGMLLLDQKYREFGPRPLVNLGVRSEDIIPEEDRRRLKE
jgi:hypothetical protein